MLKISIKVAATALFTAAVLTGADSVNAAGEVLSGDALRGAVADKTVILKVSGFELPIRYSARGTMVGRMGTVAAAFSGNQSLSARGTWWVDGSRLCQRWSSWMDGETYCYALSQRGQNVRWTRNDGRSGTARIAG